MQGERIPAELGPGTWVTYSYRSAPSERYAAGPYTPTGAAAVARLFMSAEYRRYGFAWIETVTV